MMNSLSLLIFISAAIVLYFNLAAYFKNKKSPVNQSFAIFGLAIFFWLICYGIGYLIDDLGKKLFYFRMGYVGVIAIPVTFYHFVISLIGIKRNRFFNITSFSLTYLYFGFLLINFLGKGFLCSLVFYPWGYYPAANIIIHPFLLVYFITTFSLANTILFIAAYMNFFELNSAQKVRIKYVFWGSLLGALGSLDFSGSYYVKGFVPIGFIFMLLYPIVFGYAIIKYRLMDINLVVTKASIFVAVYTFILGIPLMLIYYMQNELVSFFGLNWWIAPFLCSTGLATLGPFLYIHFDGKVEDRLLKEQKSYQNILRNASSGMIRIKDLKKLLNVVVHVVTKTVKLKHASIYIFDEINNRYIIQATRGLNNITDKERFINYDSFLVKRLIEMKSPVVTEETVMRLRDEVQNQDMKSFVEQLISLKACLVIPSFSNEKLIGILILGEKISGKLYSSDDIAVFSVLANQAALAIENAQFYNEVKMTQEQLFQAEKMATIGTMADGLSHQINNRFHALSLISGDAVDILKTFDSSNCNEETKQVLSDLKNSLERIEANVLQGGEVVKGLLKYSRPGEGGFVSVSLKDVLDGAIDMVQYKIKIKEIDLIVNILIDLPKLHANLVQLQEVFFNLIDNAYDAIKERQMNLKEEGYKGKIEVTARQVDGFIEVTVSDNGIGVKDLDRKKLFTPFFTTKATAATVKKGTGLGLYVIEKIILVHNGKIDVKSGYKEGTKFIITLPIAESPAS